MAARDSDNILGDVMESLLGANFLEAGFERRDATDPRALGQPIDGDTGRSQTSQKRAAGMGGGQPAPPARIRPLSTGPAPTTRPNSPSASPFTTSASQRPPQAASSEAETAAARAFMETDIGMTDTQPRTRCGVVAVIGAPNAGKSTLVNQLVGQKVAITSAKAQTTRARMLGIALHERTRRRR